LALHDGVDISTDVRMFCHGRRHSLTERERFLLEAALSEEAVSA
jgi:hypothetical protein